MRPTVTPPLKSPLFRKLKKKYVIASAEGGGRSLASPRPCLCLYGLKYVRGADALFFGEARVSLMLKCKRTRKSVSGSFWPTTRATIRWCTGLLLGNVSALNVTGVIFDRNGRVAMYCKELERDSWISEDENQRDAGGGGGVRSTTPTGGSKMLTNARSLTELARARAKTLF